MYADDIVLIARTAADLQKKKKKKKKKMPDALDSWCNKLRLAVNESKTKILLFRNKNKSDYSFNVAKSIEYEFEYKYLGFCFKEQLDPDHDYTINFTI